MNTAEFITRLRQMDIRVWVEDDRLRISAPKGVLTEALQHEIAARKPDLLAYLQQAEAQLAVPDTPIEPAARTGPLPLSFAQERMWILEQFEPDSASYNIAGAVRLRGQLDIAALGAAINGVVQRHEVLRTTFRVQDGQPVQQIAPALTVPLLQHDLTMQPVTARDAAARALMVAAAQRPFQLDEAPLLRVMLLRLAADEHMLAYTMHHIVSDGWSMNVFMREVVQLYRAAIAGQPASLPPLPVQYADFAVWQRAWLQGAVLVRQLAYWKRQLAAIEPLQLPTDRPRPPAQTHQGADFRAELPAGLVAGLRQLSRQQQVTLFMTLLAAFQALLHRLAGQDDVCVGTPIANRTRREVEPLIGFFVNTLVLRAQFDGDLTFRQLLRQVGQTTLAAYANQDVPFEKLVAELQPARDLSRSPLFQVMFVLQNVPSVDATLPDLTVTLLPVDNETAKFDLLLSAVEQPDGTLQLTWQYNTDLFDEATVARWMGHYETLLTGALADPDSPVDALPLLSPVELRQMLLAWNDTATPGRGLPLVHELAAAQAARTPGAVAVMAPPDADGRPGGQLTYAELEQRANQLAHRLQALGVASDVPVALLLPRSLDLAVAVLAVLKAGGAYLPLDPAYPPARLAFMLADAAAPVLLTRTDMQAVLETAVGGAGLPASVQHTLLLDAEAAQLAALPATPPAGQARPDSLIYVLYTSGSTGKPKGVALPHRAISNLVQWQLTQSTLPPEARTLQFAAISFDVFCQELFATWCAGGTVVMISETLRRDPVALLQLLAAQDVARLFLPFVALQHLAEVADLRGLAPHGLREVVTAGEQLQSRPQIVRLFSRLPACRLTNQYGPTESHVVTAYDLPPEPAAWPALPPIGRPIDNVQIYVLDGRLQPVPIGVAGELVIGGTNVACGYLHQPALTAERFVDLRLLLGDAAVHENAHCYRTGDLARFLPDGTLEYLGRADQQVKIRGYRIELEEVEAVLRQHAAVREAVVAPQALAGSQQLVAYVVPQPGAAPTTEALRAFLSETLPAHMLPATVVLLPALPLTPSGKVARSMLPAPPPVQPPASLTAPRTAVEQALTAIWEELL
ncbi:MAG: amino acid adenylation domain-containing protein, partial [Anaerolineales bacterium]|nr:amino acid adenylation domain-containing protein [Anaerolineales bacterium]